MAKQLKEGPISLEFGYVKSGPEYMIYDNQFGFEGSGSSIDYEPYGIYAYSDFNQDRIDIIFDVVNPSFGNKWWGIQIWNLKDRVNTLGDFDSSLCEGKLEVARDCKVNFTLAYVVEPETDIVEPETDIVEPKVAKKCKFPWLIVLLVVITVLGIIVLVFVCFFWFKIKKNYLNYLLLN